MASSSSSSIIEDTPIPLSKFSATKDQNKCLSVIYKDVMSITQQETEDYNLFLHKMVFESVLKVDTVELPPTATIDDTINFEVSTAYQPNARFAVVYFRPTSQEKSLSAGTAKSPHKLKIKYEDKEYETMFTDVPTVKSSKKGDVHVLLEASIGRTNEIFTATQIPVIWIVVSYKRNVDGTIDPKKIVVYMDTVPQVDYRVPFIPGIGFDGLEAHHTPKETSQELSASLRVELDKWTKTDNSFRLARKDSINMLVWGELTDVAIAGAIIQFLADNDMEEKLHDSDYFRKVLESDDLGTEAYGEVKKMIDLYISDKTEKPMEINYIYPSLFTLLCKISGLPSVPNTAKSTMEDLYSSVESDVQSRAVVDPQIYRPLDYAQSEHTFVQMLQSHAPMTQIPLSTFGETRNYTELCLLAMFVARLPGVRSPREFVNAYLQRITGRQELQTELVWNSVLTKDSRIEPPTTTFDFVVGVMATEKLTLQIFSSKAMRANLSFLSNYMYRYSPQINRHPGLYSTTTKSLTVAFTSGRLNMEDCVVLVYIPEAKMVSLLVATRVHNMIVYLRMLTSLATTLEAAVTEMTEPILRTPDELPLACYARKVTHVPRVEPIPLPKTQSYSSTFVTEDLGKLTAAMTPSEEGVNRATLVIKDKNNNETRIPIIWDGVMSYHIVFSDKSIGDKVLISDDAISVLDVLFVSDAKNPIVGYRKFITDFTEKEKFSDDPAAESIIKSIIYKPMRITYHQMPVGRRFGGRGFVGGLLGGALLGLTGAGLLYRPYAYPPYYSPPLMGGYYYGSPFYNPWRYY